MRDETKWQRANGGPRKRRCLRKLIGSIRRLGLLSGLTVVGVLLLYGACTARVNPNEWGVEQVRFGFKTGIKERAFTPGLYFVPLGTTMHDFRRGIHVECSNDRADARSKAKNPGVAEKVDAYLRVSRLWIERFGNHSQATGPLEKALALDPDNREELSQLKEIYEKKRAWKLLFEVLRKEKCVARDPTVRLHNTIEMAKLAADRLQAHGANPPEAGAWSGEKWRAHHRHHAGYD